MNNRTMKVARSTKRSLCNHKHKLRVLKGNTDRVRTTIIQHADTDPTGFQHFHLYLN